jgi:hypothetical protein
MGPLFLNLCSLFTFIGVVLGIWAAIREKNSAIFFLVGGGITFIGVVLSVLIVAVVSATKPILAIVIQLIS